MCVCVSIREIAQSHPSMEQELAHAVNASSKAMDAVYANSKNNMVSVCVIFHKIPHIHSDASVCM